MYAVLTLKIKSGSRYRSNYGTPVLSTGINNRKCDMIGTNKKNNAPQARPHPAAPAERPAAQRPKGATYGNTAVPLHKNMKTYTMKQACKLTGMNYEALKFYCNSGLVPGLKRDQNNRRVFDERCIAWINDLTCLKRCGLGIKEMRHYTQLCLEGESSIPERQEILAEKREHLETQLEELRKAIAYIDEKQRFYADVTAGRTAYCSNVIDTTQSD